jgi:hypothetical protein
VPSNFKFHNFALIDTKLVEPTVRPWVLFLQTTPVKDYALRISRLHTDVYFNNKLLFDKICADCHDFITLCVVPDSSSIPLLEKHNTVVVKVLPFTKFEFKVYLKPSMIVGEESRKLFYEWLISQGDKIRTSKKLKHWIISIEKHYSRRKFVYVDTEKTLLLLTMKNASAIGTIYRYVVNDK